MGLFEHLKRILPNKVERPITESQKLLQYFYKNPEVRYYHSSNQQLEYTGDYENYVSCYYMKGFPVIQDQNESQMQVSFLWTNAHYVPWIEQNSFEAILKPFVLLYYDTNALVDSPSIDIIEEPNRIVGYKEYERLWNKRTNDLRGMGVKIPDP